jgi:uncharacterized protein YciI
MHFAIISQDKPDGLELRMSTREVHLDYLRAAGDGLLVAGPILGEDGETPIGSIVIVEAESLDAAKAFAAGDPYAEAGLFQSSAVMPWRKVFPQT